MARLKTLQESNFDKLISSFIAEIRLDDDKLSLRVRSLAGKERELQITIVDGALQAAITEV